MHIVLEEVILRRPEPRDVEQLYAFRNDGQVVSGLGGFAPGGYSIQDLHDWVESHRTRRDEIIWVIAERASDRCIGHAGLYQINGRSRHGEFAILIGDRAFWGKGIGYSVSRAAINYGFRYLNLRRIELTVLDTNASAIRLYEKIGFQIEGRLRQKEYRDSSYVDVLVMGILESEWTP